MIDVTYHIRRLMRGHNESIPSSAGGGTDGLVIDAGVTSERAWLIIDRKRYSYPYDALKNSTIYRETGWNMRGGTKIHYFELIPGADKDM